MRINYLLLSIFFLFWVNTLFAQISISPSSGCIGTQYSFTYIGGENYTNPQWSFGDAGTGADMLDAGHTFSDAGSFTVTFTAMNGSTPISQTFNLTVNPLPNPVFSTTSESSGCVGLPVDFTSNSTGGGGSAITSTTWAFGDGGVGSGVNPSHTYNLPGSFGVTLTVIDANGCTASLNTSGMISTSIKPTPQISSGTTVSCTPPLNVSFIGSNSFSNSTTGNTLTYLWDFGNGNSSTSVNPPSQNYTSVGEYPVSLIVSDDNNCENTATATVKIGSPDAGFNVGDTVCLETTFENTATGVYTTWNYGDNLTGSSNQHTYADTGSYIVTQITRTGSCSDTLEKRIYVEKPFAGFFSDPTFLCDLDAPNNIIHFHDTSSTNAVVYEWNFGLETNPEHGFYYGALDTSSLKNPTDTVYFRDTTYSINTMGIYLTCLKVYTSHGCVSDSVCHPDTIQKPNALFMTNITEGCMPLVISFHDSSSAFHNIVSYHWYFGDGTYFLGGPLDSVAFHTYTAVGIFDAYLVIETENGCRDTSYLTPIRVGDETIPNISISETNICPGETVHFSDLSTSEIDQWHYSIDQVGISKCPGSSETDWVFNNLVGPMTLGITTCSNGCCTSNYISNAVIVDGAIGKIKHYNLDCADPFTFEFDANFDGATSWDWDFGDGQITTGLSDLNNTLIQHTYLQRGDYNVKLLTHNSASSCQAYTDSIAVHVRQIMAFASEDTLLCADDTSGFRVPLCQDVYHSCNRGYYWDFGDLTRPTRTDTSYIQHSYQDTGTYTVSLIVYDINGCSDTVRQNYKVHDVYPGFLVDSLFGCKPSFMAEFTDTSHFDYLIGPKRYQWEWGDQYYYFTEFSDQINPIYEIVYNNQNTIPIKLTTWDSIGCHKSVIKNLGFSLPNARYNILTSQQICEGDSVWFRPLVIDNSAHYHWYFGQGIEDTLFTLSSQIYKHPYLIHGNYQTSLVVTDSINCIDSMAYPSRIYVQSYPNVGFETSPDLNAVICHGTMVTFTDTTNSIYPSTRNWTLNGTTPINPDPTVGWTYLDRGFYPITLTHTTSFGCDSTIKDTVEIVGPAAVVSIAPNDICKGESIVFTVSQFEDVYFYNFDYGDGIISPTITYNGQASVSDNHTYNYAPITGQTQAQLFIYADDMLCPEVINVNVNIHPVMADFDRNLETSASDTAHCIGSNDLFTNLSINNTTSNWAFGDGQISQDLNPQHEYLTPGIYPVQLAIYHSVSGCHDTIIKTMQIFAKPDLSIEGGNLCVGDSLIIQSNQTLGTFMWEPVAYLDNDTVAQPSAFPQETTEYTVYYSDINFCKDTAKTKIFVQPEPLNWTRDTTIVIGQTFNLNGNQGSGFTYLWSPNDHITCEACPDPITDAKEDIKYFLVITDTMNCGFSTQNEYNVKVLPISSIDVPDAFTPNGDGHNDVIYVAGWGIKKLIEFSIYNRWGEKVFTTDDITKGWDGIHNGKKQNTDTYAYYVEAETWIDPVPIKKKGSFSLLR